jgi:hypothetical protein
MDSSANRSLREKSRYAIGDSKPGYFVYRTEALSTWLQSSVLLICSHSYPALYKILYKLSFVEVVMKFPALYGAWDLIILFAQSRHSSQFWAKWIRSKIPRFRFLRFGLIRHFHEHRGMSVDLLLALYVLLGSFLLPCVLCVPIFSSSLIWITVIMTEEEHSL